jgi:hypothetical protein
MKKEMTTEEKELYNDLKMLVKRANQRLVRLERLSGEKDSFSAKQLFDNLSSEKLKAVTKTNRIKTENFNLEQMEAIKNAVENFLDKDSLSTVSNIKKYKAKVEKAIATEVSFKDLSAIYKARGLWKWSEDQYGSAFWTDFAPKILDQNKNEWIEFAKLYSQEGNDLEIKQKLTQIYDYIQKHGIKGAINFD